MEEKTKPTLEELVQKQYNTIFNDLSANTQYYDVLNPKIAMDLQKIADETTMRIKKKEDIK